MLYAFYVHFIQYTCNIQYAFYTCVVNLLSTFWYMFQTLVGVAKKTQVVPKLFWDLWDMFWHHDWCLRNHLDLLTINFFSNNMW